MTGKGTSYTSTRTLGTKHPCRNPSQHTTADTPAVAYVSLRPILLLQEHPNPLSIMTQFALGVPNDLRSRPNYIRNAETAAHTRDRYWQGSRLVAGLFTVSTTLAVCLPLEQAVFPHEPVYRLDVYSDLSSRDRALLSLFQPEATLAMDQPSGTYWRTWDVDPTTFYPVQLQDIGSVTTTDGALASEIRGAAK